MRVSIWQQWASNHSASFTVVGKFTNVDAANKAADNIRHIIATISEWYQRPENAEANEQRLEVSYKGGELPLSLPEIEFATQYGIDWNHQQGIDWFSPEDDHEAVHVFEHMVFVENTGDTWAGPFPFDSLLKKMGGNVVIYVEVAEDAEQPTVRLSCIAPDEQTASYLFNFAQASFSEIDYDKRMPGIDNLGKPRIEREGLRLSFSNLYQFPIYEELPRLITYLKEQGCTDIQYDVTWIYGA